MEDGRQSCEEVFEHAGQEPPPHRGPGFGRIGLVPAVHQGTDEVSDGSEAVEAVGI